MNSNNTYLDHLRKDRKLSKLLEMQEPVQLVTRQRVYLHLCGSIMSQQLSTKVAEVFYRRFLALFGGEEPSAADILSVPVETLRAIGLSNAKANYVRNVARFEIDQGMGFEKLAEMSNEEVITYLTSIKGIGKWTVEMLLMFTLGREDVFAIDDLGIQQAMIKLYKLDNSDRKVFRENLLRISRKWKPYRTFACLHLWRWKDNTPVTE